jgi:hypothetical protein
MHLLLVAAALSAGAFVAWTGQADAQTRVPTQPQTAQPQTTQAQTKAQAAATGEPTGYECRFATGSARSYDKGRFKPEKASTVTFAIAAIDADKQSATISRGDVKGVLRVVRAVNAMHFLEVVGEGYMNVTTVYDRDAKAAKHPAVHSRHFAVVGQPIVAQYQGLCAPK